MQLQRIVRKVPVADHVVRYALAAGAVDTPGRSRMLPDFVRDYVIWGAGPRASQYLVLGAKVRAVLEGPLLRQPRGHPGRRSARAAASHHDELQRRGRRRHPRTS